MAFAFDTFLFFCRVLHIQTHLWSWRFCKIIVGILLHGDEHVLLTVLGEKADYFHLNHVYQGTYREI